MTGTVSGTARPLAATVFACLYAADGAADWLPACAAQDFLRARPGFADFSGLVPVLGIDILYFPPDIRLFNHMV